MKYGTLVRLACCVLLQDSSGFLVCVLLPTASSEFSMARQNTNNYCNLIVSTMGYVIVVSHFGSVHGECTAMYQIN